VPLLVKARDLQPEVSQMDAWTAIAALTVDFIAQGSKQGGGAGAKVAKVQLSAQMPSRWSAKWLIRH
jgi:hypothetical protein